MARTESPKRRCAIYTRKSSEEGLEQEFNSLHAQREACEAYIRSQRHEGWVVIPTAYDDGGFSGGTMERPGLQRNGSGAAGRFRAATSTGSCPIPFTSAGSLTRVSFTRDSTKR